VGVLHGSRSFVLAHQSGESVGQIAHAHSISAGLDYPGVGPEHAHWHTTKRVQYVACTDAQALAALEQLARTEGILCALETAHAIAALPQVIAALSSDGNQSPVIIVNLSGRGDKDMTTVAQARSKQ
jgi:tryptophan synthase beta chain